MARINIEDSLFKDKRYQKLLIKVGCEYKALGLIVAGWNLAQKHWLKHGHIPKKAWPDDLDLLIEVKLAERSSEGNVYIKGSKDAFKWLEQRSIAGKSKSKTKLTKAAQNLKKAERGSNGSQRGANGTEPLTLSPSLSPSPSLSLTLTQTQNSKKLGLQKTESNRSLWEAYRDAYFLRYGVEPVRNAKVNKIISQLRDRLGKEAEDVVRFYLNHHKSFYVSKLHDISFCLSDAESLRTQWAKGVVVTEKKVKDLTAKLDQQEEFHDRIREAREYDKKQSDLTDQEQYLLEKGEL